MDRRRGSRARLLAPISLLVFAFAFFLVIAGSNTSDDSDDRPDRAGQREGGGETTRTTATGTPRPRTRGDTYTVKTGDTLAAIAETVGVPVDTLLELNPELDPQALVSGQKIRLRE